VFDEIRHRPFPKLTEIERLGSFTRAETGTGSPLTRVISPGEMTAKCSISVEKRSSVDSNEGGCSAVARFIENALHSSHPLFNHAPVFLHSSRCSFSK
jgi:hypothetical protein